MNAVATLCGGTSIGGALGGRRLGAAFWIVLLAFGPVALAVVPGQLGEAMPPLVVFLFLLPLGALFAAAVLGIRTSGLWGDEAQRLVPAYHRRLSWRVTAAGCVLAWLPGLLAAALYPPLRALPVLKLLLLAATAQVGVGFLWGFLAPRRVHWSVRVALVVVPLIWFNLLPRIPLGGWWPPPWDRFHPVTLLAAVLAPVHWPFLLRCHRGAPLNRADRTHALFTNRLVGTRLDAWLWQRLAPFLRLGRSRRMEWLLVPAGAMGQLWVSTVVTLLAWTLQRLLGLPVPVFAGVLYLGCIGAFGVTLPVQAGLVGRALLLPGGPRRAQWPAWAGWRLFNAMGNGLAVAWLPTVVAAGMGGMGLAATLQLLAAVGATLVAAVVFQLFSLARRCGRTRREAAGAPFALLTVALVTAAGLAQTWDLPPAWRWGLGLAALVWVAGLLAWTLREAAHCSFDE